MKVEEHRLSRMSPMSKSSYYTATEVIEEELKEACSEVRLARHGSFLFSNFVSPDHDEIEAKN